MCFYFAHACRYFANFFPKSLEIIGFSLYNFHCSPQKATIV